MKPGNVIEYWLRYEMPTLRTIIKNRAACCAGLYHHCLSNGSFGTTLSLIFIVSRFFIRILFSSITLYFTSYGLPSAVLAVTIMRLLFFPWVIVDVVSGFNVSSRWYVFLFSGKAFFSFPSSLASLASLLFLLFRICVGRLFIFWVFWLFLKRSLAFFRKGIWL